jgi:bud site selection protein 31
VHTVHDQSLWQITRILHRRSRLISDLFYRQKAITREVYDYCVRRKLADAGLIGKWKKQGYEKLCCLACVQPANSQFRGVCVCRVPRKDLEDGKLI